MAQIWTAAQRAAHSAKIKEALRRRKDPRPPIVCKSKSVYNLITHLLGLLKPRERLLPSVWNERHRILPKGTASKTGVFRCFPFQREPMDAPADPECSSLTLCFASQVLGKTTIIEGITGWYIDQDPCAMLFVHPTESGAESWSKNRLRPLIENCAVLSELIDANLSRKTFRSGAGGNTICHIRYPGGYLILLGSNSGAMLRAHTARVTIFDEVDAYPASASGGKSNAADDGEGDPILLAERASVTFPDAFSIKTSTPTFKNFSRIETELSTSDLRKWFCPCTRCNEQFVILFSHIVWPKTKAKNGKTVHDISEARLECPACQYKHDESERIKMVEAGKWIITQPQNRGSYGYWANAFITLLRSKRGYAGWMHYFAARYLKAMKLGSTGMRTYINQVLTESFEIESEKAPEYQILYDRREIYLVHA